MKRVFALVVVLCLIATCAYGEEIGLEEMTLDNLIDLKSKVNSEIMKRISSGINGYGGNFTGGKNIEVGAYIFTCVSSEAYLEVYSDLEHVNDWNYRTFDGFISTGEQVVIYIDVGTCVLIERGQILIQPITESWVPTQE